MKEEEDSSTNISVGSYFARKKDEREDRSTASVAATLRSEKTLAEMTLASSSLSSLSPSSSSSRKEEVKHLIKEHDDTPGSSNVKKDKKRKIELSEAAKDEVKRRKIDYPSRLSLPGEDKDDVKNENKTPLKPFKNKQAAPVKPSSPATTHRREKENIDNKARGTQKSKPKSFAKFGNFMKGVHFAISGFQNPLRGEIRQKALDMGARYHGDWNQSCTHLICAFANTPKFNQVRGKGKIVKKEWIEDCHSKRMRLPWRRYALDKNDQNKNESEDEVGEEVTETSNDYDCDTDEEIEKIKLEETKQKLKEESKTKIPKPEADSYDCDTDEEIDNIKSEMKKNPEVVTPESRNEENTDDECYDAETDVDEEDVRKLLPETDHLKYESLPKFFTNLEFHIDKDLKGDERKLIQRYIVAAGGRVRKSRSKANHVLTKFIGEDSRKNCSAKFVNPSWVFACHDKGGLEDIEKYLM